MSGGSGDALDGDSPATVFCVTSGMMMGDLGPEAMIELGMRVDTVDVENLAIQLDESLKVSQSVQKT